MPDADGIDAVLFDLDGTLCEYDRTGEEVLSLAFEQVGVEPFFTATEYYDRYPEFAAKTDGIRDLREQCFAAIADERGRDPGLGRAIARAYAESRDHSRVTALPGARETVETLAGEYAVGMVTNGASWMQAQKLEGLGLDGAFESVVYAGYDTAAKPDPEPFDVILDELGVDHDRAVYVGNSVQADVQGAAAAGVRSVLVTGAEPADVAIGEDDPEPDHTISTPRELLPPPWR